jgi:rhodanese-related sulfurtransferase
VRRTIHDVLADARARLDRLEPAQAQRAVAEEGALIVDIRSELQRERDGVVPGTIHIPRNVLEWRLDPDSGAADARIGGLGRRVILMCDGGYQSSLAAAGLRDLGFERATDLAGGFQAWRAAGLPVEPAGPTAP